MQKSESRKTLQQEAGSHERAGILETFQDKRAAHLSGLYEEFQIPLTKKKRKKKRGMKLNYMKESGISHTSSDTGKLNIQLIVYYLI